MLGWLENDSKKSRVCLPLNAKNSLYVSGGYVIIILQHPPHLNPSATSPPFHPHPQAHERRYPVNVVAYTTMINLYGKHEMVEQAEVSEERVIREVGREGRRRDERMRSSGFKCLH